jgi:TetR/AcrR family transcriptional repressor of nem operon
MKSKKALYLECLKHYNDTVTRRRWEARTSEPSVSARRAQVFEAVLDDLDDPKTPNVCLMAGSPEGVDVLEARDLALVVGEMQTIEQALTSALGSGSQAR